MRRTRLEDWICEVEGLSALDRETLEAIQLRCINALLAREKARGGFYKGLPERLDSLAELRRLPFTTPEQLAQNAPGLLLGSQAEVSRIITGATSGTTGPSKRIFYTQRDIGHTVGFFAAGISELVSAGEAVAIAMPFSGPDGLGELICRAVERLGARPVKLGVGKSLGEQAGILESERPEAYIGMPVPLLGLIRWMGGPGSLRRALVSGDACPEGVVAELEKLLGSRLFPHYGSREMCLGGAVTCAAHEGMHLRENHVIAEIVDEAGEPVPDGEYGELVITTADMQAMPLIRYRTGDYTRFLPGPCPCGGVTRRLDRLSRRPAYPDMEALDSALFRLPGLVDYRAAYCESTLCIGIVGCVNAEQILLSAQRLYPGLSCKIVACKRALQSFTGCYTGKRHVVLQEAFTGHPPACQHNICFKI